MLLQEIVQTSAAVAESSSRLDKIGHLADLLRRLAADEVAIAIPFLSGELPQGRIGLGRATIWSARPSGGAEAATLFRAPGGNIRHGLRFYASRPCGWVLVRNDCRSPTPLSW